MQADHDVFQHGHGIEHLSILESSRQALFRQMIRSQACDLIVREEDCASVRAVDAGNDVYHRRLAGPFGPIRAVMDPLRRSKETFARAISLRSSS